MERLTERDEFGNANIIEVDSAEFQPSLDFDDFNRVTNALNKLAEYEDLEEQGNLLNLPCAVGDTVFDLVLCDDGKYHIFEMKVCNINPFGDVRKGRAWNVYLEDKYTKAYRSFCDFDKTVFLTKEEAEAALRKLRTRNL